jgi:flagellar hook protein FlgE
MSLSGALNSAVSALNAQSSALAMISDNLANSTTTGYKTTSASFSSLLTGTSSGSSYSSGGVSVAPTSNISAQGLLAASSVSTNMAIDGNGFFVVSSESDTNDTFYTRNGEFTVDAEGYITNNGYYLQGWPTDADGDVKGGGTGSLEAIDTKAISTIASATTTASLIANLPAEAEINSTFTSPIEVYDSLGTAASMTVTWTKTAENTWSASFSDPVLSSDTSQTIGDVSTAAVTITFNSDGTLNTTMPRPPTVGITDWTTGAGDSSITLDLGASGTSSGLSQLSTGSETLTVDLETIKNGIGFGSVTNITIGDEGTVYANYDNGEQRAIYKIPVATFANANGLGALSGGIYAASNESGTSTLRIAGTNGAGTIYGSKLEASQTDTNQEFANMMSAQQAYSGAAQIMSTANSMFDTLISAVR